MAIRVCLAGATGAVGRALAPALLEDSKFRLVGAVARGAAGSDLGAALGRPPAGVIVRGTLAEALEEPADVLIDYTAPPAAMRHLDLAIGAGVGVVLGTTGLTAADFDAVDRRAREAGVGVVTGNFSLSAALLQHFALFAARYLAQWEIVDINHAHKPDAPSGTARELAERMAAVRRPWPVVPIAETHGEVAARGATVDGVQCHSLRLPGFASVVEVIFGQGAERLSIRQETIAAGEPFVTGTLLAASRVSEMVGVVRGLDALLFGTWDAAAS
jgi:4-hydroxy-tetrahydrodipicolinate reductase